MSIKIVIFLLLFTILFFSFFEFIASKLKIYSKTVYTNKEIQKKTPLIGGFFILLGFNLILLTGDELTSTSYKLEYLIILLLSNFFFIVGFIDDKINLSPYWKILIFIFLGYLIFNNFEYLLIKEIKFSFTNRTIFLGKYSIIFTLFSIFVFINALNMFDGINGHTGCYVFFVNSVLFFISKEIIFIYFLFLIFVFFYFNIKNKFFIGNSGIFFIGTFISLTFILFYNNDLILFSDDIFLIMLVPGIDLIRLFFIRILNKKNPFIRDHNHWHHIISNKFENNVTLIISTLIFSLPFFLSNFLNIDNLYVVIISLILYSLVIYLGKKKSNS